MMSNQPKKLHVYDWDDEPPPIATPFYTLKYSVQVPKLYSDLEKIIDALNDKGRTCLKNGDFYRAMWKFNYSKEVFQIGHKSHPNARVEKLHRAQVNIALAAVKLLDCNPGDILLFRYAVSHCTEIIESSKNSTVSPTWLQKAHFRLGECCRIHSTFEKVTKLFRFELQTQTLENYCKCHELQSSNDDIDMTVIARAVAVTVNWGKKSEHLRLLNGQLQNVHISKMYKLIDRMLTVNFVEPKHLSFLFSTKLQSEQPVQLSKDQSVSLFTKLLLKCSDSSLEVALPLISQAKTYFKEEIIPCEVYKCTKKSDKAKSILYELFVQEDASGPRLTAISQCLNLTHRTQLLKLKLSQDKFQDAQTVLKHGDILPEEVFLSDFVINLLDNPALLELLLKSKVSPNIKGRKKHSKSPIKLLLTEWKKSKQNRPRIVSSIIILLNHGGDVEDLCTFHTGRRTTAVHVATELSIVVGNVEFLKTVISKSASTSDSVDQNNKTPIHILCEKFQSQEMLLYEMCELLVARSSIDEKDVHEKIAMDYLQDEDIKRIMIQKFQKHSLETCLEEDSQDGHQDQSIDTIEPENEEPPQTETEEQVKEEDTSDKKEQTETTEELLESKLKALMEKDDSYFTVTVVSPSLTGALSSEHHHEVEETTHSEVKSDEVHSTDDNGERCSIPTDSTETLQPQPERDHSPGAIQNVHKDDELDDLNLEGQCWEVVLSEKTKKFLKTSKYPAKLRKKALKRIQDIATGEWNPDLRKPLSKTKSVYEARFSRANRIIWGIAVSFSSRMTNQLKERVNEQEMSKMQDNTEDSIHLLSEKVLIADIVVDHDEIHHKTKVTEKLSDFSSVTDSKAFVAIETENTDSEGPKRWYPKLYIPNKFTKNKFVNKAVESMKCYPWTDSESVSKDQNFSKLYSLTTQQALSLIDGKYARCDYPLDLSKEEFTIVEIPDNQAILLLGRSGTGKTTCCLCRIWNKFKHYWSMPDRINNPGIPSARKDGTHPPTKPTEPTSEERVTHTSVEADLSGEELPFSAGDHATPSESDECEQTSCSEQSVHLRQVFIGKNYLFCQQIKKRFYDFVAGEKSIENKKQLLRYEHEDLPSSLSDIGDPLSYPLFLSARKFFLMLHQTLDDDKLFTKSFDSSDYYHDNKDTLEDLLKIEFDDKDEVHKTRTKEQETQATTKKCFTEVTASYFITELWPQMRKFCGDQNTDPLLVWTEIQSFIKGSFEAVSSQDGFLTMSEYEDIGKKRAPFFAGNRKKIYEVFTEYRKLNHKDASTYLYDECDFIFSLYKRLTTSTTDKHPSWSIHRLYIDEVQDFTQAELAVLLRCCQDPTGFFLTGDTAQSIVRGVSFRFEEIKSIFYDMKSKLNNVEVPKLHYLTDNHRSHSGVTDLASSVTDLLKEYFPHSFDHKNVPRDRSKYSGPLPVFLGSFDEESLVRILVENKREDLSTVEIGAHQVIIVRNESAKTKLPGSLQKSALSIEESKGLEFDDVIVYNFFSDLDTCSSEVWQVVYTYLNDVVKLNPEKKQSFIRKHHRASKVKWSQRMSLSAELKFLYTVITRAKVKLFFYESGHKSNYVPMVDYWRTRQLISMYSSETAESGEQLNLYASKSTPEEWKQQGDVYRSKKLWVQALRCYAKANDPVLLNETTAIYEILRAKKEQRQDPPVYKKAALLFLECDEMKHDIKFLENLAKCLYYAQQYTKSAELLERMNKFDDLFTVRKALNDVTGCVHALERMGNYTAAIKFLLSRGKFETAMKLALKYISMKAYDPQKNPLRELTSHAYASVQKCIKNKRNDELLKVVTLLPSVSQRVNFLKEAGLFYHASQELVNSEQYDAAFQLYQAQGMWQEAIQLAEEQDATAEMASFVLQAASASIVKHATINDSDIIDRLVQLTEHDDLETKGHALLLLAKSYVKSDATVSFEYVNRAITLYSDSKERLKIIEFESFNVLAELQMQQKTSFSTLQFVEMAAKECIDIQKAVKLIESSGTSSTTSMQPVLQFYNIKRNGRDFCIPPGEHLWLKSIHKSKSKTQEYDSNGMLLLDASATNKTICDHLSAFINVWLKGTICAEEVVRKKLDEFPFHKELIARKTVVHSFRSHVDSKSLQEYISTCNVALLLAATGVGLGQQNVHVIFDRLSSPLSLLCLPLNRQHFNWLKTSTPEILNHVERRMHIITDELSKSFQSPNKKVKTSQWLKVWRLANIIDSETEYDKLDKTISGMKEVIDKQAQVKENFRMPPYDFTWLPMDERPSHYFTVWLGMCEAIRIEGNVLYAIHELAIPHFVKIIAKRSSLQINPEDFVNICSILSTALFSLLAAYSRGVTFFLPQTFYYMVQTFNDLNCHKPDHKELLEACTLTVVREKKFDSKKVYKCLWDILDILIGRFNDRFSVLNYAVSEQYRIVSTEALHCLVLTLTIFGNMALLHKKESMFAYQQEILKALNPLTVKQTTDRELMILQEAYVSFANCRGTRDVFRVVHNLLSSKGFVLVELRTISHPTLKIQFSDKQCSLDNIPQQPLLSLIGNFSTDSTVSKLQKQLFKHKAQLTKTVPGPVNPTRGSSAAISQSKTVPIVMPSLTEKSQDFSGDPSSIQSSKNVLSIGTQMSFPLAQTNDVAEESALNPNSGTQTYSVESDKVEHPSTSKADSGAQTNVRESDMAKETTLNPSILESDLTSDDEHDSDEELPMDYYNVGTGNNVLDAICTACGEPNSTVHEQTNEHKEKVRAKKEFEDNFKWQYESFATELRDKIRSGKQSIKTITEKHHKMINEADELLQAHNKVIESIMNSCNWIEGLSQLEGITDEVENCLDSLKNQAQYDDKWEEYSQTEDLQTPQEEEQEMKFDFDRQESMDEHSKKRGRRKKKRT